MSPLFVILAIALALAIAALAASGAASAKGRQRRLAWLAAFGVLLFAGGGYVLLGSPQLTSAGSASQEALLSRAVAALDQEAAILRRSGQATIKQWTDLASQYWSAGKLQKSADALGEAAALAKGKKRDALLGSQAQALVSAHDKRVTDEARAIFADILSREPDNLRALFFMGLAADQAGDKTAMRTYWGHLLRVAPDKTGWRKALEGRMQGGTGKAPATAPAPGPGAAKVNIAPGPERDMIEGMVARLAKRLQTQGGTAADWARLGKSFSVLGRPKEALEAYAQALRLAPGDVAIKSARDAVAAQASAKKP